MLHFAGPGLEQAPLEDMQLALTAARVDQKNFGIWLKNWQVGQTLNALVTGQRPSGEIVLRVAGQQITATADIPVQQGSNLLLEVKQLRPVPILRIINTQVQAVALREGTPGTLRLLPPGASELASQPLAQVANTLRTVDLGALLPPPGVESVQRLLRQVANPAQLTSSAGVQSAVRSSGTLLESHLMRASVDKSFVPPPGDMKAGNLRALAQVNAAIEQISAGKLPAASVEALLDIKRELEGSLASITLNQLNSQPTEQATSRSWIFDIPFQLAGTVRNLRIHIERDAQGQGHDGAAADDADAEWRVGLDFTLPQLGPLTIAAKLRGVALFMEIGAANPASRAALESGVSALASALESRGLELKSLQWRAAREHPTPPIGEDRDGGVDLTA